MLRLVLLFQILIFADVALSQTVPSKPVREAEIKTAVEKLKVEDKPGLTAVLFDMRVIEGKFIRRDDRTFTIDAKRKKLPSAPIEIRYDQVLELIGDGVSISYFPDPDTAPYSTWDELKLVAYGDTLEIDRLDGEGAFGIFLRVTESEIFLLDGNKTISVKRDEIKRVFLARREPHSLTKARKGAAKASRSVRPAEPASRTIGSSAGAAVVNTAVLAGTATAGAISSVARRSPNDRLLIYAK